MPLLTGRKFGLPVMAQDGGCHAERMIGMPKLSKRCAISIAFFTWRASFPAFAASVGSASFWGCHNRQGNSTLPQATRIFFEAIINNLRVAPRVLKPEIPAKAIKFTALLRSVQRQYNRSFINIARSFDHKQLVYLVAFVNPVQL